ncbi:MAG: DNA-directed RNA polymerase subunit G [Desulfurococcales archaeon]|nr:DNA-directed RNA polymerase subunit G [Desulfurococcales archaeon]
MELVLKAIVEKVEPGKLRGQRIARARAGDRTITFDVIENLFSVEEGDTLEILVSDSRPENLDPYDFCAHGYLAASRDNAELLSLWGILFLFEPPIGLQDNVKYYLCIKRSQG